MSPESHRFQRGAGFLPAGVLPPALAGFLAAQQFACISEFTNLGVTYILKAPAHEIDSVRGQVLIHIEHQLHRRPTAPVLRSVTSLHDRPNSSLRFETYTNVSDPDQRAKFAALRAQRDLYLLFYDEDLHHRLTKRVGLRHPYLLDELLVKAAAHRQRIPDELFDFDRAKAEVMSETDL